MSENKRSEIRDDIINKLSEDRQKSAVCINQVDAYMSLWDCEQEIQTRSEALAGQPDKIREYLACIAELRQLEKGMISILEWLGISPSMQKESQENADL